MFITLFHGQGERELQIGKNSQLPNFNLLLVKRIFFKSTRTPPPPLSPKILYIDWEGLRRYKNGN